MLRPRIIFASAGVLASGVAAIALWREFHAAPGVHQPQGDFAAADVVAHASLPTVTIPAPVDDSPKLQVVEPEVVQQHSETESAPEPVVEQAAIMNAKLRMMDMRYPDLAKEFGISAKEAEDVFELLLARRPNWRSDVEGLLGPAQWKEYESTLDARRRVNELSKIFTPSAPLSDHQRESLLNTISEEERRLRQEGFFGGRTATSPAAQLDIDDERIRKVEESSLRIVAAAGSYLNHDQLALLEIAMTQANDKSRTALQLRRERLGVQPEVNSSSTSPLEIRRINQ